MTACEGNLKHYSVASPEMMTPYSYSEWEPPEPYVAWVCVLAENSTKAKALAIKDKEFEQWAKEARGDGVPPFKKLRAVRFWCKHFECLGCQDECYFCNKEYDEEYPLDYN